MDNKEVIQRMKTDEDYRVAMQQYLDKLTPDQYRAFLEDDSWAGVPYARSFFHVHSDLGSPMDSVLTVRAYHERAQTYGASFLSLTDHGTMYGLVPLDDLITKGNKGNEREKTLCVGCELYVCEDVEHRGLRKHLCAYALDETGYEVLCHLVTQSQYRIIQTGNIQHPCVSFSMLEKYIGPGTEGHGHIALTSACIGGVVLAQAVFNERMKEKIAQDTEEIRKMKDTENNRSIQKKEADIEKAKNAIVPDADTEIAFEKDLLRYDALAGHGLWYAEMQYHGIGLEKKYMPVLATIAKKHQIPLLAANDAHMLSKSDCELRKYLNSMRFGNEWSPKQEGDEELYLKTDPELYAALRRILPDDLAFEAMMGRDDLAKKFSFHYTKKERFPKYHE